jgi:hypothetical protein
VRLLETDKTLNCQRVLFSIDWPCSAADLLRKLGRWREEDDVGCLFVVSNERRSQIKCRRTKPNECAKLIA